jgi:uncharacterized protein GlcG (DUF336 family)
MFVAAMLAAAHAVHGAQPVINERTLSVDAALEIATTALANCRTHGVPVTITVIDHAARVKAVLRDDGANLHSSEHSFRTTAAGGLPIRAGNTVVGAIGISGTPGAKGGGAADEGCAQVGIDKVMKGVGG